MKDEELGELLRETFTSKERQVDSLPAAIKSERRRTGPILLAAASVLVVLGGILYAVNGGTGSHQGGPGTTTTVPGATGGPVSTLPGSTPTGSVTDGPAASEKAQIWGAVLAEILEIEKPPAGWPGARVLDAPNAGAGGGTVTYELAQRFTANERAAMERALHRTAQLEWVRNRPLGGKELCQQPVAKEPYVTLGPIVQVQGHVEVGAWMWRGCLDAHWITYRLDQQAGGWKITGTVGPQGIS